MIISVPFKTLEQVSKEYPNVFKIEESKTGCVVFQLSSDFNNRKLDVKPC